MMKRWLVGLVRLRLLRHLVYLPRNPSIKVDIVGDPKILATNSHLFLLALQV
jgi:hypothetical protein